MTIKLENFVSPKTLVVLQTQGLHKVAGAMNRREEITLKDAAEIIGTKAYIRRREFQKIAEGIDALAAVTEG